MTKPFNHIMFIVALDNTQFIKCFYWRVLCKSWLDDNMRMTYLIRVVGSEAKGATEQLPQMAYFMQGL